MLLAGIGCDGLPGEECPNAVTAQQQTIRQALERVDNTAAWAIGALSSPGHTYTQQQIKERIATIFDDTIIIHKELNQEQE